MQLLLRVLYHISARLESLEQYASQPTDANWHRIFEEEFRIKFVPNEGPAFVQELYQLCEAEGLLKPVPEESPRLRYRRALKESGELFAKHRVLQGIDQLKGVLEVHQPKATPILRDLLLQESTYQKLHRKSLNGLAQDADKIALNQAVYRCITLVSDTQKLLEL